MGKAFIIAAACLFVTVATAQTPNQAQQDQERFTQAITASVLPLTLTATALDDDGGTWLTQHAKSADLLLIGEMHGVADIAHTATLLAKAQNATVYAAEVGPTAAWKLNAMLRAKDGTFDAYMADARRANSFAFLNMREEAAFARAILQNAPPTQKQPSDMWGLDQEFITSGPLLMERLSTYARTQSQKDAIVKARGVLEQKVFGLIKVPPQTFADLKTAFADTPEAVTFINDIALSAQIYDALGYDQNAPREDLMKRIFLSHWKNAKDKNGNTPKIVMKMGSNHLQAGLSTTMVPAFGGFVRSLALIENKKTFSVLILCGPGGAQRAFNGSTEPCAEEVETAAKGLVPHLRAENATVFNTAPLRTRPGVLKRIGFSDDLRQYIFSYDAIVVLPHAKPATHYAVPDAKWFE
jgi:hypothetical protein